MQRHAGAGHLVVVPLRRVPVRAARVTGRPPPRHRDRLVFGALRARGDHRSRRSSARPRSACARAFDWSMPFADNVDAQIFFVARLPRTLAGALVGATLAAAGVVFQGLLRNPLATPFTLGVSAGAALGAMLAITFGWTLGVAGISAVPLASFAGVARRRRRSSTALAARGIAACRPTCCCSPASR